MAKNKSTDEAVMELLVTVERKKGEIAVAKKKPQWKTNCTIGFDPDTTHDRVNIMTIRDPNRVMELYVFLMQKKDYRTRAAEELGLPIDLTYLGYPIGDWQDDLKTRAAQLSIDQKQKDMEALDARVNKLVSPDQRRKMELEALQQILNER